MSESQFPSNMAKEPITHTEASRELTDKIHRLVRKFSRDLVQLVAQEIGARAIKVRDKPGPKKGHKPRRQVCPLCNSNENCFRRFGFICRQCRAGKPLKRGQKLKNAFPDFKRKKKDTLGVDYRVTVPVPTHLPVKPQETPVPDDVEPDFLDTLAGIFDSAVDDATKQPKENPASEAEDWEFFK